MISTVIAQLMAVFAPLMSQAPRVPTLPEMTWEEAVHDPHQHLGRMRRMVVQHHSQIEEWNPYLTRFSPEVYRAVRAWTDAQLPWVQEDYEHPLAALFVRRGSRAATLFASAAPHDRIVVACVVRARFLGRPWVEVISARRMHEYVPEGTVLHTLKAIELLGRQAWDMARDQLERALDAPLPGHAREALQRLLPRPPG